MSEVYPLSTLCQVKFREIPPGADSRGRLGGGLFRESEGRHLLVSALRPEPVSHNHLRGVGVTVRHAGNLRWDVLAKSGLGNPSRLSAVGVANLQSLLALADHGNSRYISMANSPDDCQKAHLSSPVLVCQSRRASDG